MVQFGLRTPCIYIFAPTRQLDTAITEAQRGTCEKAFFLAQQPALYISCTLQQLKTPSYVRQLLR